MSQYELVDLWISQLNFSTTIFVAFISATSALLIVAHLTGKDLHQFLYRIITALYSVAAVFFLLTFAKSSEALLNIRGQMHMADMDWYNAVYEPQIIAPLVIAIGILLHVILAVGSLLYFKSTRSN